MTQSRDSWFERIPRRFFSFSEGHYALYLGMGYLLVGILHYRIWSRSDSVQTLMANLELDFPRPGPSTALLLYSLWGMTIWWLAVRLLRRLREMQPGVELVFWGTALSIFGACVPWFFASSVVNTMFLFLIGMTVIVGFGLAQRTANARGARVVDPWKAFVHALKGSVAILALLAGALATAILLPWRNTEVEGPEFFRYSILFAYLVFGLIGFILMPLLLRALEGQTTEPVELEPPGVL